MVMFKINSHHLKQSKNAGIKKNDSVFWLVFESAEGSVFFKI